ncbi:glycosyltransferase family 2 protein [Geosporobacter ferrireducens]|uniref:Glycosyl transferase n=1 Tax=Geosporobacter ferrireducens TaxID=1424294 RepID=A0A1D8GFI5_9FIRM|nr:glycosyltransferase [Geosporobacter ferrireducens]AOT69674.1 glycosyl transferase [Geosporobacter ferrireducens]MTI54620.1 glycosyltransferase family 2 protein [Geosporobacter ferrireducens]
MNPKKIFRLPVSFVLKPTKRYIPIAQKFAFSHVIAFMWMIFSIYLSFPWVEEIGAFVTLPAAFFIVAGIAYIPGYLNAFMVFSLLFDRQPAIKIPQPSDPVTILVACYNEEMSIESTLGYIAMQDYEGELKVIVIDNNSTDNTSIVAEESGKKLGINLTVLHEPKPGKNNALNSALNYVDTELLITLDADTLLHKSAIRYIVGRLFSSPSDVCAVAGTVLVRNSRGKFLARVQEWDYFLGIASIKRLQGMFQGTLVAQGAFSLYRTEAIRKINGWPDAIGEDIVLTWNLLSNNWKVYFEPLAVAFTDVPESLNHFFRQRSRWARGMVEALKVVKPWHQPLIYTKYLTSSNLIMPYLDIVYTFCWIPGLFLAFFGYYWIVGLTTLLVLPLAMIVNYILYHYQKKVFKTLGLRIRKNAFGFIAYVLFYQMLMSPISVWGYFQEIFRSKRIWK